ncbi:hypothetical protein J7L48_09285, partial [bacterium]|nr:hypothetical protein [bacterium]
NKTKENKMKSEKYDLIEFVFKKIGFKIISKNFDNIDFSLNYNGKKYIAKCKYAKDINSIIFTIFYHSVVHLEAELRRREIRNNGISIFIIDNADKRKIKSLDNKFKKLSPEISWLLIKNKNCFAYRFIGEKEINFGNWKDEPYFLEEKKSNFNFSDLELWMFKVLFYHNNKNHEKEILNAFQLSKIAKVSRRTSNNWINIMREKGFIINEKFKKLRIVKMEEYLDLWTGKYYIEDNDIQYYEYFGNHKNHIKEIIKKVSKNPQKYILTGHFGSDLYKLRFSNANTLHLYDLQNDISQIEKDLYLVPKKGESDIIIMRAKYPESIKRGMEFAIKNYVVDFIQLYLDCYHLKDRGKEQANLIERKLILNG